MLTFIRLGRVERTTVDCCSSSLRMNEVDAPASTQIASKYTSRMVSTSAAQTCCVVFSTKFPAMIRNAIFFLHKELLGMREQACAGSILAEEDDLVPVHYEANQRLDFDVRVFGLQSHQSVAFFDHS